MSWQLQTRFSNTPTPAGATDSCHLGHLGHKGRTHFLEHLIRKEKKNKTWVWLPTDVNLSPFALYWTSEVLVTASGVMPTFQEHLVKMKRQSYVSMWNWVYHQGCMCRWCKPWNKRPILWQTWRPWTLLEEAGGSSVTIPAEFSLSLQRWDVQRLERKGTVGSRWLRQPTIPTEECPILWKGVLSPREAFLIFRASPQIPIQLQSAPGVATSSSSSSIIDKVE